MGLRLAGVETCLDRQMRRAVQELGQCTVQRDLLLGQASVLGLGIWNWEEGYRTVSGSGEKVLEYR